MDSHDVSILEERIKNIIITMRQWLLNFVNRVPMDSLRTVVNDLVERNVLGIKGDKDKDSFYVIDDGDCTGSITSEEIIVVGNNILCTSAENLIQEKLHETLLNRTKVEVKRAFSELNVAEVSVNELSKSNPSDITQIHVQESAECGPDNGNDNILINALKSEITFWRNEVNSKDEIIKLQISDTNIL